MTLPELCECSENPEITMPNSADSSSSSDGTLGKALLAVLQQAASQGRATCSLTACVHLLSTRPDDVMLCIMPALAQHADAAATIQSTLIRAVCQEHAIRVLSVDCDVKLAKAVCAEVGEETKMGLKVEEEVKKVDENCNPVLLKTPSPCSEDTEALIITSCDNMAPVMGFPCVLVEYPQEASVEDEVIGEFCKKQLYGEQLTEPYIELPD